MPSLLALAHPAVIAASSSSSSKSSGNSFFLVFLIIIAVAGYFLFLRPQQQKQRRAREAHKDVQEGDEVVTVGGIVGRVLKLEDDRVHLLTGHQSTPDLPDHLPHRMTFVRNAISRKLDPPASDDDEEVEETDEDDGLDVGAAGEGDYVTNGHVTLAEDDAVEEDDTDEEDGETSDGAAGNGRVEGLVERGLVAPDAVTDGGAATETDPAPGPARSKGRRGGRGRRTEGGTREGTAS